MKWNPNRQQLAVMLYCSLPVSARTSDIGLKLLEAMKSPPDDYPCTPSQLPSAQCKEDK